MLRSVQGARLLPRVLELARRPHDKPRAQRLLPLRSIVVSRAHVHVKSLVYALDADHLGPQLHVQLRILCQLVQVVCVLRA